MPLGVAAAAGRAATLFITTSRSGPSPAQAPNSVALGHRRARAGRPPVARPGEPVTAGGLPPRGAAAAAPRQTNRQNECAAVGSRWRLCLFTETTDTFHFLTSLGVSLSSYLKCTPRAC